MKKLLLFVLPACLAFACQTFEPALQEPLSDEIYVSMEGICATRTSMDENNNVLWSAGDQLVAFMQTTLPCRYQIKEQYVGSNAGGFTKVDEPADGDDLETGSELGHNVILYPYSSEVWCMKNDSSSPTGSYKLNIVLPEVQRYAENSFGNGAFPMVAVSSDRQLTFRNICGGVKLQLKGVDKVKSIKVEGVGAEPVSGKASLIAYVDRKSTRLNSSHCL